MMSASVEYKRPDRVADQIRIEVADILARKAADPRLQWVTIQHVALSPDLRHAKLFITVPLKEPVAVTQKEALLGLKTASGFIRSELARRLPLRRVPELLFVVDRDVEQMNHLLGLLEQAGGARSSEKKPVDLEEEG
jgi:ribosome-binding factor A